MIKKGEIILIGIIILGAILSMGAYSHYKSLHKGDQIAVIIQNNKIIRRIDLDKVEKPEKILISGDYHNLIRVEKGRIRFEKADCPNKICVHTGWLEKYGDIAVCMPNRVLISIEQN